MWVRERDVIDHALISVVTLLAYLQLPFRPEIRETLRWWAEQVRVLVQESPEVVVGVAVLLVALFGVAFTLGVVRHAAR